MAVEQHPPTVGGPSEEQQVTIPQGLSMAAHKIDAGDLRPAEVLLRRILEKQPDNPHALHLLGIIAHRVGRSELALELIGQAISRLPDEAAFHMNRGEMCRLLKRVDEAIGHGESATRLNPQSAVAFSNLGIAYYDRKEYAKAEGCHLKALELSPHLVESLNNLGSIMRARKNRAAAIDYYRKVLAINPHYLESLNNLGALLVEDEQPDEAIQVLLLALKLNPNHADAHNNIGNALLIKDQYDKATAAYTNALRIKPDYPEAQLGLARVFKEQNQLTEALAAVKRALTLNPDKPESHCLLGDIHLRQGDYEGSRSAYLKALSLNAELVTAHIGLGQLQMEQGELKGAEESFAKAIQLGPEELGAYLCMAQVKKINAGDPTLIRLESEMANIEQLPPTKALALHFSLGKAYDDLKDYDRAFPHFLAGCRIKRGMIEYNPDQHDLACRNIREIFSRQTIERLGGAGDPSALPIFVLGMPRSGTTLVETILASHPAVFGAGELPDLLQIASRPKHGAASEGFPFSMQGLTTADLTEMGARYIAALRRHFPDAQRITDKMPMNFVALGLIHLMLPNAKIIHVMRNAADICLSAFTKNFNQSQPHSYDLVELGRYYVNYELLMEHWRGVLPAGAFYEVQYERLVGNPEEESRKLVDFCGLEWDDACLSPHTAERNIKTASVAQVRQPIYTDSVERWRHYAKHLQPLLKALGKYAPIGSTG